MAYGGGTWNPPIQNKVLPGTYIVFSSKARPSNIFGERGYVACGVNLDWGASKEIITVEPSDLQKESLLLFGHEYTDEELLPLRELLAHAKTAYVYRLNGDGEKAIGTEGEMTVEAFYSGTRGNDIVVVVENDIDESDKFKVSIRLNTLKVFDKTVSSIDELEDNGYVVFKKALVATSGLTLTGGTNGTETTMAHTDFLEKLEKKYINMVAYAGTDEQLKRLYKSYVERRVNLEGSYFQGLVYDFEAGSELMINLKTKVLDRENVADLTYWVAGAEAGCEINATIGSKPYDGELKLDTNYKQRDLTEAIKKGYLVFHEVDDKPLVLSDINSFTNFSIHKNEDFSKNQIMRVLHQIGNDFSTIFNTRYLDKVQNNNLGRTMLWNDYYNQAETYQKMGAISDLKPDDLTVELGDHKDSVLSGFEVQPTMAMAKLYINTMVA